jgi:hypothetical protein
VTLKFVATIAGVVVLAACAGGGNSAAVEVCKTAVQERMTDQNAKFADNMSESVTTQPDGTIVINSSFTGERLENGTPVPYTQTFTCSVAPTDEKGNTNPRVIRMQINW